MVSATRLMLIMYPFSLLFFCDNFNLPLKIKPVPGAPPDLVKAYAESSTSIRVVWQPPPENKQNGKITYYKIHFVVSTRLDSEATVLEIKNPDTREFVIDELRKWTEYRIWMLAGTQIGDGPISYPVVVKTDEDGRLFKRQTLNNRCLGNIYWVRLQTNLVCILSGPLILL